MATMLDYLDWYGDIEFDTLPFNEVDALVLAQLSYLGLEGIVASEGKAIRVEEASRRYFERHATEEIYSAESLGEPLTPFVLEKMAAGRRFAHRQQIRGDAYAWLASRWPSPRRWCAPSLSRQRQP